MKKVYIVYQSEDEGHRSPMFEHGFKTLPLAIGAVNEKWEKDYQYHPVMIGYTIDEKVLEAMNPPSTPGKIAVVFNPERKETLDDLLRQYGLENLYTVDWIFIIEIEIKGVEL